MGYVDLQGTAKTLVDRVFSRQFRTQLQQGGREGKQHRFDAQARRNAFYEPGCGEIFSITGEKGLAGRIPMRHGRDDQVDEIWKRNQCPVVLQRCEGERYLLPDKSDEQGEVAPGARPIDEGRANDDDFHACSG